MIGNDRAANASGDKILYVRVPAGLKAKLEEAKTKHGEESVAYMVQRILEYFSEQESEKQQQILECPANASGDKIFYVRVPAGLKAKLEEAKTKHGEESVAYMVQRILEYFSEQESEKQQQILEHPVPDSIAVVRTSGLIKQLAWADHAFGQKRWTWAAEEYLKLAEISSKLDALGTWELALYKSAYCMYDIANELRKDAVIYYHESWKALKDEKDEEVEEKAKKHLDRLFGMADQAAEAGIKLNEQQGEKSQGEKYPHTVVSFNIACGWAIRAACHVQRIRSQEDLLTSDRRRPSLLNDWLKLLNTERKDDELRTSLLPEGWRELLEKEDKDKVERHATQALDSLRDVVGKKSERDRQGEKVPQNNTFLIDLARKDLDLEFLREDKFYSERLREAITKNDTSSDMLVSCEELIKRVEKVLKIRTKEVTGSGSMGIGGPW